MRSYYAVGLAVLAGLSVGCSTDASQPDALVPTDGTPLGLAVGNGNACKPPKTNPSGKIIDKVVAPSPWAVAVRDDGLAYFTAIFQNAVGITNVTTRTITGFIPTGSLPTGIAFNPDGTRAYTANQGDNTVSVIDVATARAVASISTGGSSPFSVEVSPDGLQIFVGNNDNSLMIIDAQTLQITKTVSVGFATNSFAVDPAGRMLYANHFASGQVSEIDMFTGAVVRTFNLGGTPQGMALNKRGTHLYVANQGGYLSDISLLTGQVGAPIPILGVGFGVGVTPNDAEAWITFPLDGKVQVFGLQSRKIKGTLNVGGEPRRISFSESGKIGALTDFQGKVVFVR